MNVLKTWLDTPFNGKLNGEFPNLQLKNEEKPTNLHVFAALVYMSSGFDGTLCINNILYGRGGLITNNEENLLVKMYGFISGIMYGQNISNEDLIMYLSNEYVRILENVTNSLKYDVQKFIDCLESNADKVRV